MSERAESIHWGLMPSEASHIFFDPVRRSERHSKPASIKGVQACPAVQTSLSRSFMIRCPFDLRLRLVERPGGVPHVHMIEAQSSVNAAKISRMMSLMPQGEWRNNDFPVLQIATPYVFISESVAFVSQRYPSDAAGSGGVWRLIEGRFPIHLWRRPLSWAIEWINKKDDLILRRGDPWFNVDFEISNPSHPILLNRKELTDDIKADIFASKDVSSYVHGTFSLFKTAHERRKSSDNEREAL